MHQSTEYSTVSYLQEDLNYFAVLFNLYLQVHISEDENANIIIFILQTILSILRILYF
jgi:hypothetical protein